MTAPPIDMPFQSADEVYRSVVKTTRLVELFGPWMLTIPGGSEVIDAWHRSVVDLGFRVACQALTPSDGLPTVAAPTNQAQRPTGSYADNAGTLVYVAHNAAGEVIYVGITDNLFARMVQHSRDSAWWPHMARLTWEEWPDREAALRKESRLIKAWQPPYNKMGNPSHRRPIPPYRRREQ